MQYKIQKYAQNEPHNKNTYIKIMLQQSELLWHIYLQLPIQSASQRQDVCACSYHENLLNYLQELEVRVHKFITDHISKGGNAITPVRFHSIFGTN